MNQKGFVNIILIFLVVVLTGAAGYFAFNNYSATPSSSPPLGEQPARPSPALTPPSTPTPSVSLLRVCPEAWYDNQMPVIAGSNNVPNEYFIYKGVRRELAEFDVNWVKINCSIKPQAVY